VCTVSLCCLFSVPDTDTLVFMLYQGLLSCTQSAVIYTLSFVKAYLPTLGSAHAA
jgi:hypothetical protein